MLALLIDATDNSDNVTWRSLAIFFSAFQNSSSRLTLVLRPASKIERLTTSDFMMVPASCVGTMVPKCGAIWQADTKQGQMPLKLRPTGLGSGIDKDRSAGWGCRPYTPPVDNS